MFTLIAIVLSIGTLIAAILAIQLKNMVAAIVSAGVVSLFASILYVLLASPDVAMTEASIGSGLTTVIFLYALSKIDKQQKKDNIE
jgi:energy-converting hydrogenase B subunit D